MASEFVELADKFLAMLANERGASEHTVRAYAREVRDFAAYLQKTMGDGAGVGEIEAGASGASSAREAACRGERWRVNLWSWRINFSR